MVHFVQIHPTVRPAQYVELRLLVRVCTIGPRALMPMLTYAYLTIPYHTTDFFSIAPFYITSREGLRQVNDDSTNFYW